MLELELRLQANGKKCLEDGPRLKFWMFSRTTRSTILNKSSIKMYAYDHQMYVASEKMKEVKRTLTNSIANSICWNVILIQIPSRLVQGRGWHKTKFTPDMFFSEFFWKFLYLSHLTSCLFQVILISMTTIQATWMLWNFSTWSRPLISDSV